MKFKGGKRRRLSENVVPIAMAGQSVGPVSDGPAAGMSRGAMVCIRSAPDLVSPDHVVMAYPAPGRIVDSDSR